MKTLIQSFYIALGHISILTLNKKSKRQIKYAGPHKISKQGMIRPIVNPTFAKDPPPLWTPPFPILLRGIASLNALSRTIPLLNTLNRTIPYLNTLSRTIPYLNTVNRTIPFLNTLNRTIPYLITLSQTVSQYIDPNYTYPILLHWAKPYLSTLTRTVPYPNTLSRTLS